MELLRLDDTQSNKLAIIYIRQSSEYQRDNNLGSQYYQRSLENRARELGAKNIKIIEDLGEAAQFGNQRDGFDDLIERIEGYSVSIVFLVSHSRIGRNLRDQGHFLGVCELTDTLVADHKNTYNLRDTEDKLIIDIHGLFARNEMVRTTDHLKNSRRAKAEKGEIKNMLSTGYMHLGDNVVFDSDPEVCAAIQLVFDKFIEIGSAARVVRYMNAEGIKIPTRNLKTWELRWVNAYMNRVLSILRNPSYAGNLTFGRSTSKAVLRDKSKPYRGKKKSDGPPSNRIVRATRVPRDKWLRGKKSHKAYVTQEQYEAIQRKLDGNATSYRDKRRPNASEGRSILQGIAKCGICGRNMYVEYKEKIKPSYCCKSSDTKFNGKCQSVFTPSIEGVIIDEVIKRIESFDIDVLSMIEDQLSKETEEKFNRGTNELRISERKQSIAEADFKRLVRISPEGDEADAIILRYKKELNEIIGTTENLRLNLQSASVTEAVVLTLEEKREILLYSREIRNLLDTERILNSERREICQCLLSEARLSKNKDEFIADLVWRDGSETRVVAPKQGSRAYSTPGLNPSFSINDKIMELSKTMHLDEMATYLNGSIDFSLPSGREHTRTSIASRRGVIAKKLNIDFHQWLTSEMKKEGFYPRTLAIKMLGTSEFKIRRMINDGTLISRMTSGGKLWVYIESI